jgi:hypothetical protein
VAMQVNERIGHECRLLRAGRVSTRGSKRSGKPLCATPCHLTRGGGRTNLSHEKGCSSSRPILGQNCRR